MTNLEHLIHVQLNFHKKINYSDFQYKTNHAIIFKLGSHGYVDADKIKLCCFHFLEKFVVDYHCTRVRSKENVQDFFCKVASSFLILFIVSYQFPEGKDRLKLFYMEPLLQHYLCTQSLYQCRISEIRLTLRCHIDSM